MKKETRRIKIIGTGVYVPEKVLTNADLELMVETSDEWIVTRSGIKERHIAREDQATSDLGVEAGRNALHDAGLGIKDIDLILVATNTPDTIFPSTACWIQKGLKADIVPAFDISAGCTGFVYGMIIAESLILSGAAKRVLLSPRQGDVDGLVGRHGVPGGEDAHVGLDALLAHIEAIAVLGHVHEEAQEQALVPLVEHHAAGVLRLFFL